MQKTAKYTFLSLLIIIICFVWGCREIEVNTEITPDGSCTRSMITRADSSELKEIVFHLPYDDSWNYITRPDTSKDQVRIEVSKTYHDIETMNADLFSQTNPEKYVQARVNLETRLHGFYKVFRFTEIYRALQPLATSKVPLSDYLSDEEITVFLANQDTSIYKTQIEAWEQANLFETFFEQLLYYHHKNGEAFGPDLESQKESIFEIFKQIDENEQGGYEQFAEDIAGEIGTDNIDGLLTVINYFDMWLEKTMEALFQKASGSFILKVRMPGIITQTNAGSIQGNQSIWEIEGDDFQYHDFAMTVESRMIYWPVIIITLCGIVALGVLILFALYKKKRIDNASL